VIFQCLDDRFDLAQDMLGVFGRVSHRLCAKRFALRPSQALLVSLNGLNFLNDLN
jgi:hypothetical protein